MTKPSTKERDAELAFLRDWCLTMIEYIGRGGDPKSTESQKRRIIKAYNERILEGFDGLRQAYDDYTGALRFLPPEERAPLDELLHEIFGKGFEEADRKVEKEVGQILKRGTINTGAEASLLMSRADELAHYDSKEEQLEAINRLLAEFRAQFAHYRDSAEQAAPKEQPTREDPEELAFLRDWCLTVAHFIGGTGFAEALGLEEELIQKAYKSGNLKGLRLAARDQAEMLRAAPPEDRRRLDALLHSKFGRGLDDMERKDAEEIARILKRGRIETDEECGLLLSHADQIYADDSKSDELEAINRLLGAYEGGDS